MNADRNGNEAGDAQPEKRWPHTIRFRVPGLHRGDHVVHRAPLERVHRGRPGAVDVPKLGIVLAQFQVPPVLQTKENLPVLHARDLDQAAIHEPQARVVPRPTNTVPSRLSHL